MTRDDHSTAIGIAPDVAERDTRALGVIFETFPKKSM